MPGNTGADPRSKPAKSVADVVHTFRQVTAEDATAASVSAADNATSVPYQPSGPAMAALVAQVRARASDEGDRRVARADEFVLRACVAARKGDVARAHALADSYLRWRGALRYDERRTSAGVRAVLQAGVFCTPGATTRAGHAVMVVRSGLFDPVRFATDDMAAAIGVVLEDILRMRPGARERGVVLVNDMAGFNVLKADLNLLRFIAGGLSRTMPVRLAGIVVANPPLFARMLHALFGKVLSAKLKARVTLVEKGNDAKMQAVFAPELLPEFMGFGGTLAWDDARQRQWVDRLMADAGTWAPGTEFAEPVAGESKE